MRNALMRIGIRYKLQWDLLMRIGTLQWAGTPPLKSDSSRRGCGSDGSLGLREPAPRTASRSRMPCTSLPTNYSILTSLPIL